MVPQNPLVEAYTASWIEILISPMIFTPLLSRLIQPRGLKSLTMVGIAYGKKSRLIQPRGLKFEFCRQYREKLMSRLIQPRGLKSQSAFLNTLNPTVEAYTASWIEIMSWLIRKDKSPVEAYTASWIEIGS